MRVEGNEKHVGGTLQSMHLCRSCCTLLALLPVEQRLRGAARHLRGV